MLKWGVEGVLAPLVRLARCMPVYRSEAESQQTCRGTIPVADAIVQEHGTRSFIVSCHRRAYNLRASSATERDHWVRAIRLAISRERDTKPCSAYSHSRLLCYDRPAYSRCGHSVFIRGFLFYLSFYLFFRRLFSAVAHWILPHMMWP